ncbi:YihY family inner membrane protein [Candidatus Sumerlaeota bacterium]|nr:YihY family inner membrane protein [Candidatus Sumerlaeota bacterium]
MIQQIKKFIIEWEGRALSPPKKILLRVIEFLYLWYDEIIRDHCPQRAASLTYTTLLAIFPVIAVMALFIPAFFGGTAEMEREVMGYVERIILPDAGQEIEGSIRGYFEIFRKNSRAVGVFGIVGLMVSALLLFSTVEKAFNEIWRVRRHRSMVSLFSRFTTVLIFVPLLIGASIILTAEMTKRAEILGRLLTLIVPYMITCLALTLAFYILPNTKVRFLNAFIGGFFAGLLWEMAKVAFGTYVASPKITLMYKSLGAIPIFLVWTYFTWLIVLLGCELSYIIQNYIQLKYEAFKKIPHTIVDSKLIFLVFMVIADRFFKGKGGVTQRLILRKIPVKYEEMEAVIGILKGNGFIAETDDERLIPKLPLEKIKPGDILSLGCKPDDIIIKGSGEDKSPISASEELQNFILSWHDDKTLRDFFNLADTPKT